MTTTEANAETYVVMWRREHEKSYQPSVMMDAAHACQVQRDLVRMGFRAYIIDEREED